MLIYISYIAYICLSWNIYSALKPTEKNCNLRNSVWLEDQKEYHTRLASYYEKIIKSHPKYLEKKKQI